MARSSLAQFPQNVPPQTEATPAVLTAESATHVLHSHGLTAVGRHWLRADDLRLRLQLSAIEPNLKQFHQAQRALEQRLAENELLGRQLADKTQRRALAERRAVSAADAVTRRQWAITLERLAAEQAALRQRHLPPEQVPEDAALRSMLLDWTQARNALAVAALAYSETDTLYQISKKYEALRNDSQVAQAMAALGPRQQLGGGYDFAAAASRVTEARHVALSTPAPLYRVGGHWRSSLLIGPETPVGCTLVDQPPALVIPDSAARAAGLIPANVARPKHLYATQDGRKLEVQIIQVRRIWLGSAEIAGVEAYILPPQAEDLGVLLNPTYISGHRFDRQPQQLKMVVEKLETR